MKDRDGSLHTLASGIVRGLRSPTAAAKDLR